MATTAKKARLSMPVVQADHSTKKQWLALRPVERARAGNVYLSAQSAELDVMRGEQKQKMNSRYKQTGITVNLSGALVNAAQMAQKNLQHLGENDNARVKAMAAANTACSSYKAIQAVDQALSSDPKTLINLSISGSSQHSTSHQKSREDTLQSSQLTGDSGVYLHIRGKGAGTSCALCAPHADQQAQPKASCRVPANLRSNRAMVAH